MKDDTLTEVDIGNAVKKGLSSYNYFSYICNYSTSTLVDFSKMKHADELGLRNGSCDLVYYDDKSVFTFELKRQFNMKVISQALRWLDISTGVYIATRTWLKPDALNILRHLGIGYICVNGSPSDTFLSYQLLPQLLVADMDYWNRELKLIDRTEVPAGSKNGIRSTTFSRFIARAKMYCNEHPNATLKTIAMQVPNHYSSVQSCVGALKRYADHKIIDKFWKD